MTLTKVIFIVWQSLWGLGGHPQWDTELDKEVLVGEIQTQVMKLHRFP